jgi:drug/metabolite transporter (DMT)-like permease
VRRGAMCRPTVYASVPTLDRAEQNGLVEGAAAPARPVSLAFLGIVALGGLNAIAIRFSNAELDPFWGASVRFGLASLLLFTLLAIRRVPLPRGRALIGSLLYGLLGFAAGFGFAYWGLVETPAGLAQVILALVPLLTLVFAVLQGLERFRTQSLAGSLVAVVGIAVVFAERLGSGGPAAVPLLSLVAVLAAAAAIGQTNVVVKRFPRSHPTANNAIAMGVGAVLLLLLSLGVGERQQVPAEATTVAAVVYLVLIGSVVVFMLYLYVIERWTASATSYSLLAMPLVTLSASAVVLGEAVTAGLLVGGALVLVGVYVGAFAPSLSVPLPGLLRRPGAIAGRAGPPSMETPNCP